MVNVRALLSDEGWKICLPASARTRVYAADCEFCGILRKPTELVPSAVQLDKLPEEGVPKTGVTNVGDVAKTSAPEPVSSVTAVASCAEVETSVLELRLIVLFVSVAVLLAVRTLVGVMMPDKVAMSYSYGFTGQVIVVGKPICCGTSRRA